MKHCLIILIWLIVPLVSFGQWQTGIKGGLDYYWFSSPGDPHADVQYDYSKSAPVVALTLRPRASHTFNPGLEIGYVHRSFDVTSSYYNMVGITTVDYAFRTGHIYFQLQPQLLFGKRIKFFIYPALYVGTMIQSKMTGTSQTRSLIDPLVIFSDTVDGPVREFHGDLEVGFGAGAGVEFPFYDHFSFLVEYNFNLHALPVANAWRSNRVKIMNMNLEVGLTYTFKSNKNPFLEPEN